MVGQRAFTGTNNGSIAAQVAPGALARLRSWVDPVSPYCRPDRSSVRPPRMLSPLSEMTPQEWQPTSGGHAVAKRPGGGVANAEGAVFAVTWPK